LLGQLHFNLVVGPIVATLVGGLGTLLARWDSHKMRFFIATVAALALSHVANAQKTISFPTEDGGVVFADLYGKGEKGVVLAHGGRFNKESWAKQAERLAASGFEVLAFDFRGYGKSRGPGDATPMDAPLHLDVLAAVRYLRANGAKSVSVVGGSMGGGAAGDASIASEPGEIDRLVFLGASPNRPADKLKSASLYIVARDDANEDGPRLPKIQEQYEKSPQPKQLILLEGSAHAQFLFQTDQAERVMTEILRFLSGNIATTAAASVVRILVRDRASANQNQQDANGIKSPDTSKWTVYRNEKYGFQVKYPENWTVRASKGTPPETIYFGGPYRSVVNPTLTIAIQLNMNPRKLSIEEWFAEQLRAMDTQKLEAKGCSIIGGQRACYFEYANKSGEERSTYTLLHKTDVVSFYYKLGTGDSPNCVAVIDSFRILN